MKTLTEEKFEILPLSKEAKGRKNSVSFAPPVEDDGSVVASAWGMGHITTPSSNEDELNTSQLIINYRNTAMHSDVRRAINQIVYEVLPRDEDGIDVTIDLEKLKEKCKYPKNITNKIYDAFNKALRLLNFKSTGDSKFLQFYIDGKLPFHVIPHENIKGGIKELRYVDPAKLFKVRIDKKKKVDGVEVVYDYDYKYVYYSNLDQDNLYGSIGHMMGNANKIEIDETAIICATSGIVDPTKTRTLSHIHEAVKRVNNLNSIEDAQIIHRLSKAANKLIHYVDMGIASEKKQAKTIQKLMNQHRYNMEYNVSTGATRDNKNIVSMMHDYWIPRIDGKKTSEITQLEGAQNLSDIADIRYFQERLYNSLNIPVSRLKDETPFSSGRSTEITRDEVNFHKFIQGLRNRFSIIFHEIIKIELALTNVMDLDEYISIKEYINFIYPQNNHFHELLKLEILQDRINAIQTIGHDPRLFYNIDYVGKNICGYTDEEIEVLKQKYLDDLIYNKAAEDAIMDEPEEDVGVNQEEEDV